MTDITDATGRTWRPTMDLRIVFLDKSNPGAGRIEQKFLSMTSLEEAWLPLPKFLESTGERIDDIATSDARWRGHV